MQLTTAAFPRLDLHQQRMLDLSFSCLVTDEPSVTMLLRGLDVLKTGEFVSVSTYGMGKNKYDVVTSVTIAIGGGLIVKTTYFVVETMLGMAPLQATPKLTSRLLNHLTQLAPTFDVTGTATFYYVEDDAIPFHPWFAAPPALGTADAPRRLTTVDSVSGSKFTNDDPNDADAYDYGVTFDRSPDGDVTLELDFSLTAKMTANVAVTMFDRAIAIAGSLRVGGTT